MAGVGVGEALASVSVEVIKGAGITSLMNWRTAAEVGGGLILVLILIRPLGLVGVGVGTFDNQCHRRDHQSGSGAVGRRGAYQVSLASPRHGTRCGARVRGDAVPRASRAALSLAPTGRGHRLAGSQCFGCYVLFI